MRHRLWTNPHLPILLTVCLLVLLTCLAALQYRSTSELVESQRTLQSAAVRTSIARFRSDLAEIIEAVPRQMGPPEASVDDVRSWLAERNLALRSSSDSVLVGDVLLVTPREGYLQLEGLGADGQTFDVMPWPDGLRQWQDYLQREASKLKRLDDGSLRLEEQMPPTFSDVPGIAVPLLSVTTDSSPLQFVLILLNTRWLESDVFPDLIDTHFSGLLEDFVVRVVSPSRQVWYSSDEAPHGGWGVPDFSAPLVVGSTRVYTARRDGQSVLVTDRDEKVTDVGEVDATAGIATEGLIEVYHREGSLVVSLARAKARQNALALGIILLVAIALGLLFVLARRAQRLGQQQLDFVAGISHELRTPVASVNALADNLSTGIVKTEQHAREYGELMRREGRRLEAMVEQVLNYAASESDRPVSIDVVRVADLVRGVIDTERQSSRSIETTLTVEISAADVAVRGDADSLRTAIRNVVENAVKHGSADVSHAVTAVSRRGDVSGVVEVVVAIDAEDPAFVRIQVADDGPGIPADERPVVFDPFFRGARARDAQVPGNGLGLNIVQRIVARHGGRVTIDDAPAGGARVTVRLPILRRSE